MAPRGAARRLWLLPVGAAALIAGFLLARGPGEAPNPPQPAAHPGARADLVPYDGRSPREPAGRRERVLVALPRPALGELRGVAGLTPQRQRAYVASLRAEAESLRSALAARGVRLRGVVGFERTWNGFAATIRTGDLPALTSLGVGGEPVRRFYPALSEPVPVARDDAGRPPRGRRSPVVAVLASGVDSRLGRLGGRVIRGYDVVDGDARPAPGRDPRDVRKREVSGTALGGVVAAGGSPVMPIRIASLRAAPGPTGVQEMALSDELMAGLERASDPDGDGSTDDAVAVALVGVNAPYAGFAAAPEARAVAALSRLGTLVVAPAGDAGAGRADGAGTVGSPGAAPAALTVGAIAATPPLTGLRLGATRVDGAALLGGSVRDGERVAVLRAGPNPVAQAAEAAVAGARAVVLAEPRRGRVLPSMPAGAVAAPVLGVTGSAASALLREPGEAQLSLGSPRPWVPAAPGARGLSPFSSRGPGISGGPKPDIVADGAGHTLLPRGAPAVAGGSGVAAARVAVAAARLAARRPGASAAQLKSRLLASADPAGASPVSGYGAGRLAGASPRVAVELAVRARPGGARARVVNASARRRTLDATATSDAGPVTVTPARVTVAPRRRRSLDLELGPPAPGAAAFVAGRVVVRGAGGIRAGAVWASRLRSPAPVPLGELRLDRRRGRVQGVRFTVGAFERGDPGAGGTLLLAAARLDLALVDARGRTVRPLTPPGGARDLLPAEYAYELPRRALARLRDGPYAFRARAATPRRRGSVTRTSPSFAP